MDVLRCIFIVILAMSFGCKSPQVSTYTDTKVEYVRTYIPYALPADSAMADALLECTEDGRVIMSQLSVEASKNARMSVVIDSLNRRCCA